MNNIKRFFSKHTAKIAAGGALLVGTAQSSFATAPTVADATTAITGASVSAGELAGAVALVFAGLWVYRLIKKAGSRASS